MLRSSPWDALSHLADQGEFRAGLSRAAAIDVNELDRFDRLDWAFLKSYCAVQVAATEKIDDQERQELLAASVRDLVTLREVAPNRGEATYLLALAHGLIGAPQPALDAFAEARSLLPGPNDKIPFAENESVCLLNLAEERLSRGDAEGAGQVFDQVTRRGVLVDQVPTSLVKIRLLNVRRSLQAGRKTCRSRRGHRGGPQARRARTPSKRRSIEAICDALGDLDRRARRRRIEGPPEHRSIPRQAFTTRAPPGG